MCSQLWIYMSCCRNESGKAQLNLSSKKEESKKIAALRNDQFSSHCLLLFDRGHQLQATRE